jgi:hypothetical protein
MYCNSKILKDLKENQSGCLLWLTFVEVYSNRVKALILHLINGFQVLENLWLSNEALTSGKGKVKYHFLFQF